MIANLPANYFVKIGEHLTLSMSALALGCLVALPLGIIINSNKRLTQTVLSISSVLQTIPALALLAMIVPILGVGRAPAIVALFIYSLLPILRNTVLGMQGVDENLVDAAKGMGFTRSQIIFKVQIPLAFQVIMSGVRLSAIYVLSWTSLASYIGAGGLGDFIFAGMNNYNIALIIYGTIPIIILGIIVDFLLGQFESRMMVQTSSVKETNQ